jgi:hypothetical protein
MGGNVLSEEEGERTGGEGGGGGVEASGRCRSAHTPSLLSPSDKTALLPLSRWRHTQALPVEAQLFAAVPAGSVR